jgi:hypothetical protein
MIDSADLVRFDVFLGSIRVACQHAIDGIFRERRADCEALINQKIAEFDWNKHIASAIDDELHSHAKSFVRNSMRCVTNDMDKYGAIQRECDLLVKTRLVTLFTEQKVLEEERAEKYRKEREADND